ncbi:MAG: phosphatidylinositol mannoside acyltransferase [Acidimicrobiales bacterium]
MDDPRSAAVYAVYRALGAALQAVPEPVAEGGASVVGAVMAQVAGSRRLRRRHIARVLASGSPAVEPDPEVVRRWARRSYRAYARYWVEGARLSAIRPDAIRSRMTVESGYEHLEAGMAAGRGVVLALPHVGSWEWGGAFLAGEGYPMTTVVERIDPPALFDWLVDQRQRMGLTAIPLGEGSGGAVLRALRQGGLVGLLCDRDLVGNGVEVELFGETTTLPAGPATLALRTGAALMVAAVYSGPGRHHTGVVSEPLDTERSGPLRKDVVRVTQDIARRFEDVIRRAPEQWHLYQPNWPSDEGGPSADAAGPSADAGGGPGEGTGAPASRRRAGR